MRIHRTFTSEGDTGTAVGDAIQLQEERHCSVGNDGQVECRTATTFKIMLAAKLGWTWHRDVRSLTNIDAGDPRSDSWRSSKLHWHAVRFAALAARLRFRWSREITPLTLPEAVSMVLEKNPQHKTTITDTRISAAAIRETRPPLMPKIMFYAGGENHCREQPKTHAVRCGLTGGSMNRFPIS